MMICSERRDRKCLAFAVVAACLVLACAGASAQVRVSARLSGMSVDLQGILDDAVTDAARNPARLAGLRGQQVYLGRHGADFEAMQLPIWEPLRYFGATVPVERFPGFSLTDSYYGGDRFDVAWHTPVGSKWKAAVSADVSAYGSDRGSANRRVGQNLRFGGAVEVDDLAEAYSTEISHILLDVALCSSQDPDARAFGVRATAKYVDVESRESRLSTYTISPLSDLTQQERRFDLNKLHEAYRELGGSIALGWFDPAGTLREATIRAGAVVIDRDRNELYQYVDDEDYDGDGSDAGGSLAYYDYNLESGESRRDLAGGEGGARLVFSHGEHWRSRIGAWVTRLEGDGDAAFEVDETYRNGSTNQELIQSLSSGYDTGVTRFGATAAVGRVEEVMEHVLLAGVVGATYARDDFDEEADGSADVGYVDGSTAQSYQSPVSQKLEMTVENLVAAVSMGVEWTLPRYLTFRFGLRYEGRRMELQQSSLRNVEELAASEVVGSFHAAAQGDKRVSWASDTSTRLGASVRLADRVWVDLYNQDWDFTRFSHATVRIALCL